MNIQSGGPCKSLQAQGNSLKAQCNSQVSYLNIDDEEERKKMEHKNVKESAIF